MPEKLPDLPGMVAGIVAIRTEDGREITTLQCGDCLAMEEPERLILMKFKFIRCKYDKEPVRRCPECTRKHIENCPDETHKNR